MDVCGVPHSRRADRVRGGSACIFRVPRSRGGLMPIALITGGGGDIGSATAKALAEQGHRVVVNYRKSAAQADVVVAAIVAAGGEAIAIQADVTDANAVAAMIDEVNL